MHFHISEALFLNNFHTEEGYHNLVGAFIGLSDQSQLENILIQIHRGFYSASFKKTSVIFNHPIPQIYPFDENPKRLAYFLISKIFI